MFNRRFRGGASALLTIFLATAFAAGAQAQTNRYPPTIAGTPPTQAKVAAAYSFTPTARDADGNTLQFWIANRPRWATFNLTTGRLSGTPTAAHVGQYNNITIHVHDGKYSRALAPFSITVSSATTPPPSGTLSERYPGDVGIAADPAVIYHDPYEDSSPGTLSSRYSEIKNPAGVAMVSDKPALSRGARSVRLTAGASATATHLYKRFGTGYDEVYLRYYTKYVPSSGSVWGHSGFWFGGYNPALNYPYPRAGQKPTGSDRFSFALEPQPSGLMDMYTYWMKMRSFKTSPVAGDYYGNIFINDNDFKVRNNAWTCYEIHLKLNPNPATGQDAVFEVWENDQLVRRFDNTGPYGFWNKDKFCAADADGPSCAPYRPANPAQVLLDQQWRNTTALKFNHIWPQNYNTSGVNSSLLYDDLVVARSRVGCLK